MGPWIRLVNHNQVDPWPSQVQQQTMDSSRRKYCPLLPAQLLCPYPTSRSSAFAGSDWFENRLSKVTAVVDVSPAGTYGRCSCRDFAESVQGTTRILKDWHVSPRAFSPSCLTHLGRHTASNRLTRIRSRPDVAVMFNTLPRTLTQRAAWNNDFCAISKNPIGAVHCSVHNVDSGEAKITIFERREEPLDLRGFDVGKSAR